MDIKPTNFFVNSEGCIKIGDFGLTQKQGFDSDDDFEGDCIYLAKEVLEYMSVKQITNKSDVFSIGLSLLEIFKSHPLLYKQ